MLFLLLLFPVIAIALITGPQTATLAEMFPARTRYTAAALPHNLSAGWRKFEDKEIRRELHLENDQRIKN